MKSKAKIALNSSIAVASLLLAATSSLHLHAATENQPKTSITSDLNDHEARLEYARLLRNLKRYDESLVQFQKLLNEKPDDSNIKIEIAAVLHYQNKQNQALEILEKIPTADVNEQGELLMAEIYQSGKDYSKSESIYRAYLQKQPSNNLVKLKLAEQLSWQKRYDESVQLYRQLLADNPSDIPLRRKYALVLMWMGNESEAAEELKSTLHE